MPLSSLEVTDGAKPPMEAPRYRANGSSYLVLEHGEAYLWAAGWHDPYDALVGGNTGEVLVRTDAPLPLAGTAGAAPRAGPTTAIEVHVRIGPGATTATAADFAGTSAFHCPMHAQRERGLHRLVAPSRGRGGVAHRHRDPGPALAASTTATISTSP